MAWPRDRWAGNPCPKMLFLVTPSRSDLRLQWLYRGLAKHFRKAQKLLPPTLDTQMSALARLHPSAKATTCPAPLARFGVSTTWVKDDHHLLSHKPGTNLSNGARGNTSALCTTASSCFRKSSPLASSPAQPLLSFLWLPGPAAMDL